MRLQIRRIVARRYIQTAVTDNTHYRGCGDCFRNTVDYIGVRVAVRCGPKT